MNSRDRSSGSWQVVVFGLGEERYVEQTGLSTDVYLGRWLLLTAALLLISAVIYAVRLRRARGGSTEGSTG